MPSNHAKHFNYHVYSSKHQNFTSTNPLNENTLFNLLIKDPRTTTRTSTTTSNFKLRVSFTFLAPLDPSEKIRGESNDKSNQKLPK